MKKQLIAAIVFTAYALPMCAKTPTYSTEYLLRGDGSTRKVEDHRRDEQTKDTIFNDAVAVCGLFLKGNKGQPVPFIHVEDVASRLWTVKRDDFVGFYGSTADGLAKRVNGLKNETIQQGTTYYSILERNGIKRDESSEQYTQYYAPVAMFALNIVLTHYAIQRALPNYHQELSIVKEVAQQLTKILGHTVNPSIVSDDEQGSNWWKWVLGATAVAGLAGAAYWQRQWIFPMKMTVTENDQEKEIQTGWFTTKARKTE